jgi:hypothetical protein
MMLIVLLEEFLAEQESMRPLRIVRIYAKELLVYIPSVDEQGEGEHAGSLFDMANGLVHGEDPLGPVGVLFVARIGSLEVVPKPFHGDVEPMALVWMLLSGTSISNDEQERDERANLVNTLRCWANIASCLDSVDRRKIRHVKSVIVVVVGGALGNFGIGYRIGKCDLS